VYKGTLKQSPFWSLDRGMCKIFGRDYSLLHICESASSFSIFIDRWTEIMKDSAIHHQIPPLSTCQWVHRGRRPLISGEFVQTSASRALHSRVKTRFGEKPGVWFAANDAGTVFDFSLMNIS
jgi:hypothetical protein